TPPLAAIHWVHAVPDTMQEDMRIVDIVSNAGLYDADFRGANMFYQGIEVGSRHVRIFNSSTDPAIAQQVMKDTAIDFAVTDSVTFIHMGFARTGSTPAPILANVALPAGEAGDVTKNPIAGARVARSVMTAVLVPRSVAGSTAPQTAAFTTASAVILVDRRPPNTMP